MPALPSMRRLIRVLTMLGCHEYVKCMLLNYAILQHLQRTKNPIINVLKDSLGVVNEHAGEVSFSVLARLVIGDTQKHKATYMSEMYSLVPLFREVTTDFEEDLMVSQGKNGHKRVFRDGEQVQTHRVFFKVWFKSVMAKHKFMYNDDILKARNVKKGFLRLTKGSEVWRTKQRTFCDVSAQLLRVSDHLCDRLGTYYLQQESSVWPIDRQRALNRTYHQPILESDEDDLFPDQEGQGPFSEVNDLSDHEEGELPDDDADSDDKSNSEDEQVWQWEAFLNHRVKEGVKELLVRWGGDEPDTWEPETMFKDHMSWVEEYHTDAEKREKLNRKKGGTKRKRAREREWRP